MKDQPLVSIVTVVYNGEQYLEDTIQSVINQTYDNIEYIIVDGGSTDGTLDVIKKYEDKIDYWISEKDEGIYDAMNKGIELANGDIIGIVNSDDFLYPECLKIVVDTLQNTQAAYTYGDVELIDNEGNIVGYASSLGIESIKYKFFKHMPFLHPTMFLKKDVYSSLGLYSLKYSLSADYDFTLKLAKSSFIGVRILKPLSAFRVGGASDDMKAYLQNYHILRENGVHPALVLMNYSLLLTKAFIRKLFK